MTISTQAETWSIFICLVTQIVTLKLLNRKMRGKFTSTLVDPIKIYIHNLIRYMYLDFTIKKCEV